MGLYPRSTLRAELEGIIGRNPDAANVTLNRWLDFGYLDLAGLLDFERLHNTWTLAVTAGTYEYNNDPLLADPSRYMGTRVVFNPTTRKRLDWVPIADFLTYDLTSQTSPIRWSLKGSKILVQPTGAASLEVTYKEAPAAFADDNAKTVLASIWDQVVVLLAASHGFSALNEEERSAYFLQKAQQHIQTHITEDRIEEDAGGMLPSYPKFQEVTS